MRFLDDYKSQPNIGLRKINQFVNKNVCINEKMGLPSSTKRLDDFCQKIGKVNLKKLNKFNKRYNLQCFSKIDIIICSKISLSGGHSFLIQDIVSSSKNNFIILITGIGGKTDIRSIKLHFKELQNIQIYKSINGNFLSKLNWIQQEIIKINPSNVWLLNAHEDSVAVGSVQPNQNYKVRFIHHADDKLCLGSSIKYFIHYDTNPNCFYHCRKVLKYKENIYLPLTCNDYGKSPFSEKISRKDGIISCTVASFNKLEVPYYVNYKNLLHKIILSSNGKHLHIGKISLFNLINIRISLFFNKINQDRFIYVPYSSNIWKMLIKYKVNVLIGSFPHGAGRTFVEAMGAGITLVLHRSCLERNMGGVDLGYKEVFQWTFADELLNILSSLDKFKIKLHSRLSREHYEEIHNKKKFKKYLGLEEKYMPTLNRVYLRESHENYSYRKNFISKLRIFLWMYFRGIKSIISMYFS